MELAAQVLIGAIKWALLMVLVIYVAYRIVCFAEVNGISSLMLYIFTTGLIAVLTIQLVLLWLSVYSYWTVVASFGLLAGILSTRRLRKPPLRFGPISIFDNRNDLLLTALVSGAVAGITLYYLLRPPFWGDALTYHLPMAAQWVQQKSLMAHDVLDWFFPGNAELVLAFLMLPFRADYVLVLSDPVYWLIATLAFRQILLHHNVERRVSLVGALALTSTPVFLGTIGWLGNDLFLVMAFLLCLFFIFEASDSERPALPILLAAASAAVVAGTKYNSLFYSVLLVVFGIFTWKQSIGKTALRFAPVAFGVAALLGGSYFLRNLILTGNPVYPIGVSFLGIPWGDLSLMVAFPREFTPDELARSTLLRNADMLRSTYHLARNLVKLAFAVWIVPSLVFYALAFDRQKIVKPDRRTAVLVAILLAAAFVFLSGSWSAENIPGTLNQIRRGYSLRFGLVALALVYLIGLAVLRVQWLVSLLSFLVMANVAVFAWLNRSLAPALVVTACLLAVTVYLWHAARTRSVNSAPYGWARRVIVMAICAGVFCSGLYSVARTQIARRPDMLFGGRSDVLQWLAQQSEPLTLLVSVGARSYPFFGPNLENRVVALSLSSSVQDWQRQILDVRPDFVVVSQEQVDRESPTVREFPQQEVLLSSNPDFYTAAYSDSFVRVYAPHWSQQ